MACFILDTNKVIFQQSVETNTSKIHNSDIAGINCCDKPELMNQDNKGDTEVANAHILECKDDGPSSKVLGDDANSFNDDEGIFEIENEENDMKDYETLKGMVKSHYVSKSLRKKCQGCGKTFSMTRRQRHCRRCGEIFCISCVKNKLKLNRLARPDPNGKLRKVCKTCYHEDSLDFGCSRSHFTEFTSERKFSKLSRILNNRTNSLTTSFWPDQIDRKAECLRLMKGFKESVTRYGNSKTIQEVRVIMKTPSWQKSRYWEIEIQATRCRSCHEEKGVRKSSGNCRICGLALCKKCSYKELMLYMYDNETVCDVRLTIINTRGCPQTEPSVSLLLYTCKDCKDFIIDLQENNPLWFVDEPKTLMEELVRFNDKLSSLCEQINIMRGKIEDLLDDTCVDDMTTKNKNIVSTYVVKLKEQLDEFDLKFKSLKSFTAKVETNTQRTFMRHYTKGKYDFLMENKCKCRAFSNKIEKKIGS